MGSILNVKINLQTVPKDRMYKGKKGTYLDFTIAERKEEDQFGNTHNVYLYRKGEEKIYIGNAKLMDFDKPKTRDDAEELNQDRSGMGAVTEFDDLPF